MPLQATTTLKKISGLKKRIRCIAGSQGAGKTFSILILLINHCAANPNKRCMVVSEELSKMRTNVVPDFQMVMKIAGIYDKGKWNSSDCCYTFPNGSTIKFMGTDKEDAGKGTRLDVLFVNEANKVPFEAYRELSTRSNNVYIDYNPNLHCWIDDNVIPREDCDFLRVTWRDNEMLGEQERNEIKRYATMAFDEKGNVKDEYWYNIYLVYSEGRTGHFVGTIFTNITTSTIFPDYLSYVHGLDVGYNDQDGLVKVAIDKVERKIYAQEMLYQNQLSTKQLIDLVKQKAGRNLVVCDSAAAKTVADLKQGGVNAISCSKKRIVDDIKDMQGYQIVVVDSPNLIRELNNWRWKDKEGKSIPEDGELHLVDPMRYAFNYLTKPAPAPSKVVITKHHTRFGK